LLIFVVSNCVNSRRIFKYARLATSRPAGNPRICIALSHDPNLVHSKGLTVPLTPLESALTSRPHLVENTQFQVLQNQHLRIFSPQALWIQHLHENMGGGGPLQSALRPSRARKTAGPALATRLPRQGPRLGRRASRASSDLAGKAGNGSRVTGHVPSRPQML